MKVFTKQANVYLKVRLRHDLLAISHNIWCSIDEKKHASSSKLLPRAISRSGDSKSKVTLGQYQRSRIQELLKTSDDPAKALADATINLSRQNELQIQDDHEVPLAHNEEQKKLKKEVTDAFHNANNGETDEGDFFTKKGHSDDAETETDPESYRKYLIDVLGGKENDIREILKSQTSEASGDMTSQRIPGVNDVKKERKGQGQDDEEFLVK